MNETGTVVSAQDYYPYGETLRGYISVHPYEKYRFTEKERDIETGYDYFGGRLYDPVLPMWLQADPLSDKYPGVSPYNYCLNNPLRYVDPDGQSGWDIVKGGLAAIIDNFSLGYSNLREQGGQNASSASDYNLGQDIGDAISATAGVIEIIAGAVSEGGGVIVTAGSGGAGAVVGAPAIKPKGGKGPGEPTDYNIKDIMKE